MTSSEILEQEQILQSIYAQRSTLLPGQSSSSSSSSSQDDTQFSKTHQLSKGNDRQRKLIQCTNRVIIPRLWDRILFSHEVSSFCQPPLFELSSADNSKKVFVGFEIFADGNNVVVPDWIMKCIGDEGDNVKLTLLKDKLQTCTQIKLLPVQPQFFDEVGIPLFFFTNSLPFKYSAVTQGQIIELGLNGKNYNILVSQCKPQQSVWMLDVQADFQLDDTLHPDKYTHIQIGQQSNEIIVDGNSYHYIKLDNLQNKQCASITITNLVGQTACFASRRDPFPKMNRFNWSNIQYEQELTDDGEDGQPVLIPSIKVIQQQQISWNNNDADDIEDLYISVYGVIEVAHFIIRVDEIPENEFNKQLKQQQDFHRQCHIDLNEEEEDDEEEEEEEDDDEYEYEYEYEEESNEIKVKSKSLKLQKDSSPQLRSLLLPPKEKVILKRCSNCRSKIPEQQLVMHERYCPQRILICPKCSFKIGTSQKDKHDALIHTQITCDCGINISSIRNVPLHMNGGCTTIQYKCPVCTIRLKKQAMYMHRDICNDTIYQCIFCTNTMKGSQFLDHLLKKHNMRKW